MEAITETTDDWNIRETVLRQLAWAPEMGVEASVKEGAVTLTGFVPSWAMKVAAEEVAKSADGVRSVRNEIHVEPLARREHWSPVADQLREHIRNRILRSR